MKKKQARKDMLKMLSKDMRKMSHEDMEDKMGDKPMKVTVAADSEEGLKKGLSKAEEIMKAKNKSSCK